MNAAISRKAALIIVATLLAGCSAARSADPDTAANPAKPGSALLGTWIASNAMPDKGFTKITFSADKTAFAAFKHAVSERRYGTTGFQRFVPHFVDTISIKHIAYEWHADATHVWMNVKGQSSGEEMSYNVDAGTLTFGPDAATQFVMHRDAH